MKKNNPKKKNTQEIKSFRRGIAVLKKKGLIDKKYDARSVTPTKYLKSQLKQFANVLSGEATPVKVNKQKREYYKEAGYTVKNGRVVVPHLPNEKVYGSHGNFVTKITTPSGSITRTDRGISARSIATWEEGLKKEFKRLKPNEQLSFQIGDNFTDQKSDTIEDLLMFLHNYKSFQIAHDSGDPNKEENFINAIIIYKLDRTMGMPKNTKTEEQMKAHNLRRAEAYQKYIARRTPEAADLARKQRAEKSAEFRKKLTPEQREKENEKSRLRAKKSYAKRIASHGKKDSGDN